MTIDEFKSTQTKAAIISLFGSIVFAFSLIMFYLLPFVEIGYVEVALIDLIDQGNSSVAAGCLQMFLGVFFIIIGLIFVPMIASVMLNKTLVDRGLFCTFCDSTLTEAKKSRQKRRAANSTAKIIQSACIAICAIFIGIIAIYLGKSQISSKLGIFSGLVKPGSGAVWALVLSVLGNGITTASNWFMWYWAKKIKIMEQ